jgi:hypothetical protein
MRTRQKYKELSHPSPNGNRLEALERDRAGQHSIRIKDQWRVCFRWTTECPEDVEIVAYQHPRGADLSLTSARRANCSRLPLGLEAH